MGGRTRRPAAAPRGLRPLHPQSPHILTEAERQTITDLAGDIEGLWHANTTTTADRKEIIRAVVDKVVVTVLGTSERVKVTIVWAGGTTTAGEVIRPVQRLEQLSYYPQLTDRIHELAAQGIGASGIANRLEAEGFRPAKGGKRISAATVRDLMRRLACPAGRVHRHRPAPPGEEPGPDEWWLKHLAAELDMTTSNPLRLDRPRLDHHPPGELLAPPAHRPR